MKIVANILVALVALLHAGFLVLEMFLWTTPFGLKMFNMTAEFAASSAVLAADQGLYNGFLAAGLICLMRWKSCGAFGQSPCCMSSATNFWSGIGGGQQEVLASGASLLAASCGGQVSTGMVPGGHIQVPSAQMASTRSDAQGSPLKQPRLGNPHARPESGTATSWDRTSRDDSSPPSRGADPPAPACAAPPLPPAPWPPCPAEPPRPALVVDDMLMASGSPGSVGRPASRKLPSTRCDSDQNDALPNGHDHFSMPAAALLVTPRPNSLIETTSVTRPRTASCGSRGR